MTVDMKVASRRSARLIIVGLDVAAASFIEHLTAAIRIPTVSHSDRAAIDYGEFVRFREFLRATYPLTHQRMQREVIGGHSLLYTWAGSAADTKPILLMAHQDVVPIEPDADWERPPFAGLADDEYLWGRGTLDDKGSLIAILEAAERLLGRGFWPRCTIYLAFGHDEEIGGSEGAAVIAASLAERKVRLEFVLDEGGAVTTGVFPMIDGPLALIGIGEKGAVDIEITAMGEGGHSSMPPPSSAVGVLAEAIRAIETNPMPPRLAEQQHLLGRLAELSTWPRSTVLRHHRLFAGRLKRRFAAGPHTSALIRTTAAVTMVAGGVKSNVLPKEARAVVNFRIMPGDSSTGVVDHVRSLVGDRVAIHIVEGGFTGEPSPLSDPTSDAYELVANTIGAAFAGAPAAPWILMAGTDSRYFHPIADNVFRFAPFTVTAEDMNRIHGAGERIRTTEAAAAVAFYEQLMTAAGS